MPTLVKIFLYFWVRFFYFLQNFVVTGAIRFFINLTIVGMIINHFKLLFCVHFYYTFPLICFVIYNIFVVFSSIKPLRLCFEMLLLFSWFVTSKFCWCIKSIIVSRTLFCFNNCIKNFILDSAYLYFKLQSRLNLTNFCYYYFHLQKTLLALFFLWNPLYLFLFQVLESVYILDLYIKVLSDL